MTAANPRTQPPAATAELLAIGALLVLATLRWIDTPDPQVVETPANALALSSLLSGNATDGFARADRVRPMVFPDDHGAHPNFRSEWWYFTGNLQSTDGTSRHFGFQLTFFRFALAPETASSREGWRTGQTYMAHVALTDTEGGAIHYDEQFSRGALNLAGAQSAPFRVWLGAWQARGAPAGFFPLTVSAHTDMFGIDVTLSDGKPMVLQGDRGLSRKSPEPGNASYYYSYTRLPTAGTVRLGEAHYEVVGTAWMDREWSTSALAPGTEGWDWFALQLDDGSELMYYRLRRDDGRTGETSGGVLVAPDGTTQRLLAADVVLEPVGRWRSPRTAVTYPVGWRLAVPEAGLDLAVRPRLDDQELNLSVRYWEGAVSVTGQRYGTAVAGVGYLELAGY